MKIGLNQNIQLINKNVMLQSKPDIQAKPQVQTNRKQLPKHRDCVSFGAYSLNKSTALHCISSWKGRLAKNANYDSGVAAEIETFGRKENEEAKNLILLHKDKSGMIFFEHVLKNNKPKSAIALIKLAENTDEATQIEFAKYTNNEGKNIVQAALNNDQFDTAEAFLEFEEKVLPESEKTMIETQRIAVLNKKIATINKEITETI